MEHEEQGEKLAQELERLDEHSDEVGAEIDEARREWEAKEDDPTVPGAQPDPEDGGDSGADHSPGTPGDEGTATGNPDAAGADEGDQAGA
jgi:hypothetical protein